MENSEKHILVVSDNEDIHKIMLDRLGDHPKAEGYNVEARSHADALHELRTNKYDMMVMDLDIRPNQTQLQLMRDIPTVVLSNTRSIKEDVKGAYASLLKPYVKEDLVGIISDVLAGRMPREQLASSRY